MMTMEVKRVGIGSVFMLFAAIFMIAGLISGLFAYQQIAEVFPVLQKALDTRGPIVGIAIGILFSFACGIVGGVFYAVAAVLYNLFAGLVGGVRLQLVEEEQE